MLVKQCVKDAKEIIKREDEALLKAQNEIEENICASIGFLVPVRFRGEHIDIVIPECSPIRPKMTNGKVDCFVYGVQKGNISYEYRFEMTGIERDFKMAVYRAHQEWLK